MRDFYMPLCNHDHTPLPAGEGLVFNSFPEDTFKTLLNAIGTLFFLNPDKKPIQVLESEEGKNLINATTKVLLEGISTEFGKSNPDLVAAVKANIFVFSGFKTYQMLKDVSLALLDDKGKLVSLTKFKEAVQSINSTYNVNWLETEYITANLSARQAAKWEKYARQADKYDLEYDAVDDSHTSDLCKRLNGVVKPVNDSFWDSYYPPNHWRCRSTVRQVSKGTKGNDIPADTPKPQNMFNNNVGKKGIIFPDSHPYFEGLSAEEKTSLRGSIEKARETYLAKALNQAENKIKNLPFEHSYIFDKYGNEILYKIGEESKVQFTAQEQALMVNNILTHNHPTKSFFSYNADITTLIGNNLLEIRAVQPDGEIYILTRPENGWGVSYDDLIDSIDELKYENNVKLYSGKITEQEHLKYLQEGLAKDLLKMFNLAYKIEKL